MDMNKLGVRLQSLVQAPPSELVIAEEMLADGRFTRKDIHTALRYHHGVLRPLKNSNFHVWVAVRQHDIRRHKGQLQHLNQYLDSISISGDEIRRLSRLRQSRLSRLSRALQEQEANKS